MQPSPKILEVEKIKKSFQKNQILSDVSFTLETGEILVLVGENGAGKSTLLSILSGLLKPDSGKVLLFSKNIIDQPAFVKGKIAYVPQEIALHSNLNIKDTLLFWASMLGIPSKEIGDRVQSLLEDLNLLEYAKQKVGKLSVGLRRRVNIAVSLLSETEILIMDEPTAGLDVQSRSEIIHYVKKLKESGISVIYVTHIANEIDELADRVLQIKEGKGIIYENVAAYRAVYAP